MINAKTNLISDIKASANLELKVLENIPTVISLFWPEAKNKKLTSSMSHNQTINILNESSIQIDKKTNN